MIIAKHKTAAVDEIAKIKNATELIYGTIKQYATIIIAAVRNNPNVNGTEINAYTLKNGKGISVRILNLGGIINELRVPDKNGCFSDIIFLDALAGGRKFCNGAKRCCL